MIVSRGAKSVSIYLLHLLRVVYEERERERERETEGGGGEFAKPRYYRITASAQVFDESLRKQI